MTFLTAFKNNFCYSAVATVFFLSFISFIFFFVNISFSSWTLVLFFFCFPCYVPLAVEATDHEPFPQQPVHGKLEELLSLMASAANLLENEIFIYNKFESNHQSDFQETDNSLEKKSKDIRAENDIMPITAMHSDEGTSAEAAKDETLAIGACIVDYDHIIVESSNAESKCTPAGNLDELQNIEASNDKEESDSTSINSYVKVALPEANEGDSECSTSEIFSGNNNCESTESKKFAVVAAEAHANIVDDVIKSVEQVGGPILPVEVQEDRVIESGYAAQESSYDEQAGSPEDQVVKIESHDGRVLVGTIRQDGRPRGINYYSKYLFKLLDTNCGEGGIEQYMVE